MLIKELQENINLYKMLSRDPNGKGFLELVGKKPAQRGKVLENTISLAEFAHKIETGEKVNQLGVFLRDDLIRIDIDYIEGVEEYIKRILPTTTTFKTKRGYHLYFKTTQKIKKGDYVLYNQLKVEVIPPLEKVTAVLPFNDPDRYIVNNSEPMDLPLEWSIQKAVSKDSKPLLPISEGGRDETIFKIACVLKDKFKDSELLHYINTYATKPPLEDIVIDAKWDSANSYESTTQIDSNLFTEKGFLIPINGVKKLIEENEILVMVEAKARIPFLWNGSQWMKGSELEIKDLITDILPDTYVTVENKNKIYKLLLEEPSIRCRWRDFNTNQRRIYFSNSVYDLDTKLWYGHSSTNMNTYCIPHSITSKTPIVKPNESVWFKEFAHKTNMTNEDIKMLLEYISYCMIPSVHLKCSLFLTGPTNTGKSILIKQLMYMVGQDNMSSVTMHGLNARFASTEMHNKLVNEDGDGGSRTLKDISSFKKMTGGDRLLYEEKGEKPFMFTPFAKNIFSFNKLPLQQDENTDAFYGRLRIIELSDKLYYEDKFVGEILIPSLVELIPYMLYTILPDIYWQGISNSPNSQIHVNQLYCASDPIQEVLNSYVIEKEDTNLLKKELYELYVDMCLDWQEQAIKYREFIREMRAKGYKDLKEDGEVYFKNIAIYKGGDK